MAETGTDGVADALLEHSKRRAVDAARTHLGKAIREVRASQGKSLTEVARAAGVSPSLLSQVERGIVTPSLDSLWSIAHALGTAPFKLLAREMPEPVRVVRGGDRVPLPVPGYGSFELLAHSLDGAYEVAHYVLEPRSSTMERSRPHEGHEANFVLAGEMRLEVGDEAHDLAPGDFILFDARLPHRGIALGEQPVAVLMIISPSVL